MIRCTAWKTSALAWMLLLACMGAAQARDEVQARSPQRLDALIDALVTTPGPISPGQLYDMGVVGSFYLEHDTGLRIYRSQPMRTADGYTIENVEYRVRRGKEDDILVLFARLADAPCFPLQRLTTRYALQPYIYPPSHAPATAAQKREQFHSLDAGALQIIIRSQRDAPHCVLGLTR